MTFNVKTCLSVARDIVIIPFQWLSLMKVFVISLCFGKVKDIPVVSNVRFYLRLTPQVGEVLPQ